MTDRIAIPEGTDNAVRLGSKIWRAIITMSAAGMALILPAEIALPHVQAETTLYLKLGFSLVFIADFILHLRHYARIRVSGRIRTFDFLLLTDFLSAVPWYAFPHTSVISLAAILKLFRVAEYMDEWRKKRFQEWIRLRLVFFVFWLLLAVHWITCGWIAIGGAPVRSTAAGTYLTSLFWTVQTLTTVGYGDQVPKTESQIVFCIVIMFLGAGIYGYIIGNIADMLAKRDPAKMTYIEQMERLGAFMRYRGIPEDLQKRITHYYTYLWSQRLGYNERDILEAMPLSLRTEVSMFLVRDIIEKVPMFREASDAFIRDIVLHLRPIVFTPGDYVVRVDEIGRHMYFVSKGTLHVLARDESTVLGTIKDGDFFGEIALLLEQPRTASVRAVDYCDLYVLEKAEFDRIVANYPEIAKTMTDVMNRRQEKGY